MVNRILRGYSIDWRPPEEKMLMGNWAISIKGVGQHHNGSAADAEQIADHCVKMLQGAGHNVTHAEITTGGSTNLLAEPSMLLPVVTADPEPKE